LWRRGNPVEQDENLSLAIVMKRERGNPAVQRRKPLNADMA
jgi:hypothetical protein